MLPNTEGHSTERLEPSHMIWTSMNIHEHPWTSMNIHEHPEIGKIKKRKDKWRTNTIWTSMNVHEQPWTSMNILKSGNKWKMRQTEDKKPVMNIHEHPWTFMNIHEHSWTSMNIRKSLEKRRKRGMMTKFVMYHSNNWGFDRWWDGWPLLLITGE